MMTMQSHRGNGARPEQVSIAVGNASLEGDLITPQRPQASVLFSHGDWSSRRSRRNRYVARVLRAAGFATLLLDLLTPEEQETEQQTGRPSLDIEQLGVRLVVATDWLYRGPWTQALPVGYFGVGTGAAAALIAAVERPEIVFAVVSRDGRPDLAGATLTQVRAPTLLLVGERYPTLVEHNLKALGTLTCERLLEIVPKSSHQFEESGAMEDVASLARDWYVRHLSAAAGASTGRHDARTRAH
jgi:putative phosphoribosyl transferase